MVVSIPCTVGAGGGSLSLGMLATESLSKTTKVTKTAHIFDFSLLYNSVFVNFVKNDNELNLSSVGFEADYDL